jgi:5'-nucleotidase
MTLTAQQIKNVLEQQFPGCMGQTAQRILQVSNGLKFSWSAGAAPCSKIVDVTFTPTDVTVVPPVVTGKPEPIVVGGIVRNPNKTYRVTVNSFLASGGDGFAILGDGADVLGGAQDIDALVNYLSSGYKAPAAPYDPHLPALNLPRIIGLP